VNFNLEKVTPYSVSERITSPDMVYLDWNESSYLPDIVSSKLQEKLNELNQYPDPNNTLLKSELSHYTNIDKEFIEAFNGSDSALDYTFRTLLNSKDKVLVPFPNYTQINQTIQSLGAYVAYCDITSLEEAIENHKPQMVYLSNPNNPTGYVYDIRSLVKKYTNIYFVVDEAYYEFYTDYTVFDLAYKVSNLVVTRTFSKGLGLAGVRLGYLTTNSYIMNKIRTIKNFKEVSRLAEAAGVAALQNIESIKNDIQQINKTKKKFISELKGVRTYDSYANFVLIEHPRVKDIIDDLKQNNILVRDRSKFINNTIRITIGKPDVMGAVAKIINRHSI
jgi:histidinol-phosphate aminotransferase